MAPPEGTAIGEPMLMKVDLPDPDGPMMATSSPASMVRETSRSAWTTWAPTRSSFESARVSMTGSALSRWTAIASASAWPPSSA